MFKRKGGGIKGFLNNVKKTALFLHGGFPYLNIASTFGSTEPLSSTSKFTFKSKLVGGTD